MSQVNQNKGQKRSFDEALSDAYSDCGGPPKKVRLETKEPHHASSKSSTNQSESNQSSFSLETQIVPHIRIPQKLKNGDQKQCKVCEGLVDDKYIMICCVCNKNDGCEKCLRRNSNVKFGTRCHSCTKYRCFQCGDVEYNQYPYAPDDIDDMFGMCGMCAGTCCYDCLKSFDCKACLDNLKFRPKDTCQACGNTTRPNELCGICDMRLCEVCSSFGFWCYQCGKMECGQCADFDEFPQCEKCSSTYCGNCWEDKCPVC